MRGARRHRHALWRAGPDGAAGGRRATGPGGPSSSIEPGRVGTERAPCFRGDDCGISVASRDVFARAPVVPISFAAPPGADYDPTRLALGLGLAVLLLAIAAVLIRRTDWSAVGEAAAPEIDDAEYADLDAIIAALPPEEDESVLDALTPGPRVTVSPASAPSVVCRVRTAT